MKFEFKLMLNKAIQILAGLFHSVSVMFGLFDVNCLKINKNRIYELSLQHVSDNKKCDHFQMSL